MPCPAASSTTPSSPISAFTGWSPEACRAAHAAGRLVLLCRLRDRPVAPPAGVRARRSHGAGARGRHDAREPAARWSADGRRGLVSGHDFYSTPRFSPGRLAAGWLAWRHPQMPWDGTELWVADLAADGALGRPTRSPAAASESIFQPGWSPDGTLYFVSDRTGWWNLYRLRPARSKPCTRWRRSSAVRSGSSGRRPGRSPTSRGSSSAYTEDGRWHLATIDLRLARSCPIDIDVEPARQPRGDRDARRVRRRLARARPMRSCESTRDRRRRADSRRVDCEDRPGYLSVPEAIEFPTDGRPDGARVLLPATQPGFHGARRRAPAADRHQPRRSDGDAPARR